MCWTTYKEELATPRTADKGIKVFKVCRPTDDPNCAEPYYFNHYGDYKVGKTYFIYADVFVRQIKQPNLQTYYEIDRGYHSYNPEKINVSVEVKFGYNIMDVSKEIQDRVKQTLQTMTGIETSVINVRVSGIDFRE